MMNGKQLLISAVTMVALGLGDLTPPVIRRGDSDKTQSPLVAEPGWLMSGNGRKEYQVKEDPDAIHEGRRALRLEAIPQPPKYGTWVRAVDAAPYRGKRIRIAVVTRTEGATGRVDFWARIQPAIGASPDGPGLEGQWINLPSSEDWTRREVVFEVPVEGHEIQHGVGLSGPGKVWLADAELEVVE